MQRSLSLLAQAGRHPSPSYPVRQARVASSIARGRCSPPKSNPFSQFSLCLCLGHTFAPRRASPPTSPLWLHALALSCFPCETTLSTPGGGGPPQPLGGTQHVAACCTAASPAPCYRCTAPPCSPGPAHVQLLTVSDHHRWRPTNLGKRRLI